MSPPLRHGVVGVVLQPADEMHAHQSILRHIQANGARPEAESLHLARVESLNVLEDGAEPLAIARRRFAVLRRPEHEMDFALRRLGIFGEPWIQDGAGGGHLGRDFVLGGIEFLGGDDECGRRHQAKQDAEAKDAKR